ncbi:MAG: Ig-like domain repeat protein [Acidobacteriaceae bacterium]|nr:Ig-like domain repeat protein [Acidobacteriaceae bacterium]
MKNIFLRTLLPAAFLFSALPAAAQNLLNVPASYPTIQAAVNAASDGDTVYVTAGTYAEHVSVASKAITLMADPNGAAVIIKPSGSGPAISLTGTSANVIVDGFSIQGGGLPATTGGPHGAIYLSSPQATLRNLKITGAYCAGLYASTNFVSLYNSSITGTLSSGCASEEGTGSAIVLVGNTSTAGADILGNTLTSNTKSLQYSGDKGGGAGINATNLSYFVVDTNLVANNVSGGYGGAIYTANILKMSINNNVIYGNTGLSGGLDLVVPGSTVGAPQGVISNNTIAYNTATSSNAGSDIYIGGNLAQYQLVNNVVVGNSNGQYAVNCGTSYSSQTVTPLVIDHNDIYSVTSSTNKPIGGACSSPTGTFGNISADPLFVDASSTLLSAATAKLNVQSGSPIIDSGNNSETYALTTDFVGNPRYVDATGKGYANIDMGAYEFASTATPSKNYTTLTLTPSTWNPTIGGSVILSATSSSLPGTPTGTITFYEDGTALATVPVTFLASTLSASYTVTGFASGTHTFYAAYSGDTNNGPASSIYLYLLASAANATNTSTKLSSSLNPSNVGDTVKLTAAVAALTGSSTPTGTVYFTDGAASLGSAAVDSTGSASVSVTDFTAGSHSLTAGFVPTGAFNGSTGVLTQIVNPAALKSTTASLSVTPTTSVYGQSVSFLATVTPTTTATVAPTGNIQFLVDGNVVAASASTATGTTASATYASTALTAGTHSYTCQYLGDSVYNSSTCAPVSGTISASASSLTLAVSNSTPRALTAFTAVAHLTSNSQPVSGGTVTLSTGSSTLSATTNASGDATFTLQLNAGPYTLAATAVATASYTSSQAGATVQVIANDVSATLLASATTAYQGQTVNFVVTLADLTGTPSPSGSIVLTEGSTTLAAANLPAASLTSNTATLSIPLNNLAVGSHTISASYLPDLNSNALTTAITPVTVTILPSSFTVTTDPTTISIQTEHHKSLNVTVTSVGAFSGPITLGCATPLPAVLTCTFAQSALSVQQNGTATTSLNLETDAIANFYASNTAAHNPHPDRDSAPFLAAGSLLAAAIFFRRRRRIFSHLALSAVALVGIASLSGCSGHYPNHTPPGTYDVVITGTATDLSGQAVTQSAHLTLIVTP